MKPTVAIVVMLLAFQAALAQQTPTPEKATLHTDMSKRPSARPITASWTSPKLKLAHTLDLTAPEASGAEARRTVTGGAFTDGGWKVTGKMDMIVIKLKQGFTATQPGAIELVMTNLDFATQAGGTKHHFLSLYANPSGQQLNEDMPESNTFFTLRGGQYKDKLGNSGIKVLWRSGGERGELAPFGARQWDVKTNYTWRAEWNNEELVILLNGERIFGPAQFNDRDLKMPMQYIYLSKDGAKNEDVWFGFPGPVYKALRVYYADGTN